MALIGLGIASAFGYAAIAWAAGAAGFPLDDAWIHQTYARNLGLHGQWAFIPGRPSAGSTSPLWTMMLALGYALRIDYAWWTLGLNAVLLGVTAWLAYHIVAATVADTIRSHVGWVGVLVAIEWHLVWATASGMETALFCALMLGAWAVAGATRSHVGWGGVLIGLAVWTRPDGLTLLPFVALAIWLGGGRFKALTAFAIGAAAVIGPYFFFNFALSGQLWPNTFFAKQAEYAILRERPLWQNVAEIFSTPFIGALALLWPGMMVVRGAGTNAQARANTWVRPYVMLAWAATFLLAYALRLPVTYQHGRYLIPAIPVLVIVGGAGMISWVELTAPRLWRRVISRAWIISAGTVAVAFWFLGAQALVRDTRFINERMVATAKWVAANIPDGTLIAAHDIGALGYFANVQLIDLAGLVSPEVIPFIRDEIRLATFIRERRAEYFINFPGWCPAFAQTMNPVFQSGQTCDPPDLMAVYRVEP
jgi:hypothetical protein